VGGTFRWRFRGGRRFNIAPREIRTMRTTGRILGAGILCLLGAALAGGLSLRSVNTVLAVLGLLLVVAAIANSYVNDFREGYRSASER
jgi:hypothetical protein